jgi:glycine/D-amino acid oxidase-like deaminating enzyme
MALVTPTSSSPSSSPASLWNADLSETERVEIDAPPRDLDVDVAIIGAGFSGMWTAWALHETDPSLRIAILERDGVGFGASGRNGGWASAISAVSLTGLAKRHGRDQAKRLQHTMIDMVNDLHQVISDHDLEPGAVRGGTVDLIRSRVQARRAEAHLDEWRSFGFGEEHLRHLDASETAAIVRTSATTGSLFTPHCLTIQPARLAHRLARLLMSSGVMIYRGDVRQVTSDQVVCVEGTVRAAKVVMATEAYTAQVPGHRRDVIPIYSLMIATEPLSNEVWSEIGLEGRATFADFRQNIIYGQRTADGRFAFGGRGARYHFGSQISGAFDTDEQIRRWLGVTLRELFPMIGDVAIEYHWGGPLAIPRDLHAHVLWDRASGRGRLGGYVGDGVTSTFLAGRTMADLILERDSALVDLPWVGHRSRRWEPEPLRWLGVNTTRSLAKVSDRFDERRWPGVALADRVLSAFYGK